MIKFSFAIRGMKKFWKWHIKVFQSIPIVHATITDNGSREKKDGQKEQKTIRADEHGVEKNKRMHNLNWLKLPISFQFFPNTPNTNFSMS